MMVRWRILSCATVLLLGLPAVVQAATTYDQMIAAIEAWLQSQPARVFSSPSAEQVFTWKVQLERAGQYGYDERSIAWLQLASLASEIGTTQFEYQYYRYNASSVRARMVETYPFSTYGVRGTKGIPGVEDFFIESWLWFRENISSIQEQTYWLMLLLGCLGDMFMEDAEAIRVVTKYPDVIHELLIQYLACSHYYLEYNRDKIMQIRDIYRTTTTIATTWSAVDTVLLPLASFCKKVGVHLAAGDREMIVKFVIPKYADSDLAVSIYVALTES